VIWTDTMMATLRRMRAAGCDDAEIALALGNGVSSRAVNGMRWRLGLKENRTDPLDAAARRAQRRRAQREALRDGKGPGVD
jgi:hypothetical protein